VVGAAEHQNLHKLLEDHSVGYAGAVASERMARLPLRQQGRKVLPYGFNEVRWERGHGNPPSSGSLVTPQMIERLVPAFQVDVLLPIRAASKATRYSQNLWEPTNRANLAYGWDSSNITLGCGAP
jgi:hypothetical protein